MKLDRIRSALAGHRPDTTAAAGKRRAAVAMVLRPAEAGPEVLFIERARHDGDPWSGHMAFPGGRVEPGDEHVRRAAERETLEEVGVDLEAAESLGRLDDMEGHHVAGVPRMVVSAFVYHLSGPANLEPNHEVAEAFWFPVGSLLDPGRHVGYATERPGLGTLPGILVGVPERHVVWGLTYRFLEGFFRICGEPLPDRWSSVDASAAALPWKPEQRSTGSGG